jgi:hypothetical protein
MGVPRCNESDARQPAAHGQKGTRKQKYARPADENESITLQPIVYQPEGTLPPPSSSSFFFQ